MFNPDETITLYAQPIGFGHKEITGQNGEKLFLMNLYSQHYINNTRWDSLGGAKIIPASQMVSHYRNAELSLHSILNP